MELPVQNYLPPFLTKLNPKSRVLVAGLNALEDQGFFIRNGHVSEVLDPFQKNLLLWTPKEGSLSHVWLNQTLNLFPSEQSQRMVASLFKGMEKGSWLGLFLREGEGTYTEGFFDTLGVQDANESRKIYLYSEKAICSLLEQTGFSVVQLGRNPQFQGMMLILAKRI